MAQSKLPAMQWYPGDWRKDPGVQALDYYDRGVWRELLDVMHESPERGRLVFPTGAPMPDSAIARLLGITEAEWKQIRSRLLSHGVASEDEDGVLYNRRMVRDEHLRHVRAEAGRKGGKASKPQSKRESKTETKRGSSSSSSASAEEKQEKKSKQNRSTGYPAGWAPNDGHRTMAAELGVDLSAEAANFEDHHRAKGSTFKDWDRAFNTWLRKARDFGQTKAATRQTNSAPTGDAAARRLEEERQRDAAAERDQARIRKWRGANPKRYEQIRAAVEEEIADRGPGRPILVKAAVASRIHAAIEEGNRGR